MDDCESTAVFAHGFEPCPFVCGDVVDLRVADSFFAFLSAEQVKLLVDSNGPEF